MSQESTRDNLRKKGSSRRVKLTSRRSASELLGGDKAEIVHRIRETDVQLEDERREPTNFSDCGVYLEPECFGTQEFLLYILT